MLPQHQVVLSLGLAFASGVLLLAYRFIFQKKPGVLLILVLAALLPVYSIFRPGTYESGDLSIHTIQLMAFYQNLDEGNYFPRWAGDLNAHYGFPLFIYTYLSPYYVGSIFKVMGWSFLNSMKLTMALTYIASGVFLYLWAKNQFKSKFAGLVGGIFYLFMPYHLVDMHFRVAVGELVAFAVVPLVMLGIQKKNGLITAVAMWWLILSHQAVSLAMMPFFLWYSMKTSSKQIWFLMLGVLLAAHYWIPVVWESKYIYQSVAPAPMEFVTLKQFFYVPWRWGLLFQGHKGELGLLLGYSQWMVVFGAVVLAARTKNRFLWAILGWFGVYLFMMLEVSKPVWYILPLLKNFQFTYRLLVMETLLISILAAVVVPKLPRKIGGIILIFTVLYTILNWANRKNIPFIANVPYITSEREGPEAAPIRSDITHPWMDTIPFSPLQALTLKRTSTFHSYQIELDKETNFLENTYYFPGWQGRIDGKNLEITHPDGIINFSVPAGKHEVEIFFTNTPVRKFALIVTGLSLILLGLCFLRQYNNIIRFFI